MLRIGFAGSGFIAGIHAGALAGLPDVAVAAVVDPDDERARAFAAEHGATVQPSYEAMLAGVDAVYLCLPNTLHASHAVEALDAGVHVFSEKPLATSPADAERVREAAARSSAVYQVGFNKHFAPVYLAVKERIESGALRPAWAHVKMNRGELRQPPWVHDTSLTGGFLYETAIHMLELLGWLFGPAREVVVRAGEGLEDFAMLLSFDGLTATFCSSAHTTWLFPYERLELFGEHATAVTEEMERVTFQLGLDAEPETQDVTSLPVPERWGYAAGDTAFVAAVRGEAPPPVGVEDGLRAVALVDACYRAAASGQPVRFD